MGYLVRFEDELALNAQMVGQKFCALAKAFHAGFAVPQAVAVCTDAHRYYLANHGWPARLAQEVLEAAYALDISQGLSIRSSAIREDLEKQSFAGQYRSFLQVVNQDDLIKNIEACWKSATAETVQSYTQSVRQVALQSDKPPLMAVVIQKMIDASAAGIAFSRNPMKPARNEIVIEAVKGLAEDLVSGHRTPYRAVVDENGMVKVTPPTSKSRLADETDYMLHLYPFWRDIAQLVKDLESYDGHQPLDIEWAVDRQRKIWLLQLRTITTLDETASRIPAGLWTRKIANDLWADRLTPFLAHHMEKNAPRYDLSPSLRILGVPVIRPTLSVIKGYLYLNCESIKKGVSHLPPKMRLPELNSLLPVSVALNRQPGPSTLSLISMSIRSVLLPIMEPGVNPLICLWLTKRHLNQIRRQIDRVSAMPDDSPWQTTGKIQAALETLTRLQIKNQWPYFFTTLSTWALRWLATNRLGLSHEDFLHLLSKNASNISIEIEKEFRAIASKIAEDREFADFFIKGSAAYVFEELPLEIRAELNNFLSRYNEGLPEDEFQMEGALIEGIGTSPGRVRGRAKIVDNPARADIQKGDILIAKNTDPGWTPILSIAGGLVMEEGGLLNHCSIVARELGVPSIVGVQRATRQIRDNDQITIDGGLGIVIIDD